MTNPSDDALAAFPPPRVTGPERPPGAVVAAAVVTWTMASITAAGALGFGLPALLLGGPIFDAFEGEHLRLYVVGVVLVVIALAAAGDVLAYLVFRRHRWARWALVALSFVSAVCGAMLGYYVAPLAITVAGLAVIVLLFLRPARAWFRSRRP